MKKSIYIPIISISLSSNIFACGICYLTPTAATVGNNLIGNSISQYSSTISKEITEITQSIRDRESAIKELGIVESQNYYVGKKNYLTQDNISFIYKVFSQFMKLNTKVSIQK